MKSAASALPPHFVLALTADTASAATSGDRRRAAPVPSPTPSPPAPGDSGLAPNGLFDALMIVTVLLSIALLGFMHMMCLQTPTQFVMPPKKIKTT